MNNNNNKQTKEKKEPSVLLWLRQWRECTVYIRSFI